MKNVVPLLLLIFFNFTFTIQYINFNDSDFSLTEVLEEEEEEKVEHKQDLLELLVNNSNVIQHLTIKLKEPLIEAIVTEVSTPPPDIS